MANGQETKAIIKLALNLENYAITYQAGLGKSKENVDLNTVQKYKKLKKGPQLLETA